MADLITMDDITSDDAKSSSKNLITMEDIQDETDTSSNLITMEDIGGEVEEPVTPTETTPPTEQPFINEEFIHPSMDAPDPSDVAPLQPGEMESYLETLGEINAAKNKTKQRRELNEAPVPLSGDIHLDPYIEQINEMPSWKRNIEISMYDWPFDSGQTMINFGVFVENLVKGNDQPPFADAMIYGPYDDESSVIAMRRKAVMYYLDEKSKEISLYEGGQAALVKGVKDLINFSMEVYAISGIAKMISPNLWAGKDIPARFVQGAELGALYEGTTNKGEEGTYQFMSDVRDSAALFSFFEVGGKITADFISKLKKIPKIKPENLHKDVILNAVGEAKAAGVQSTKELSPFVTQISDVAMGPASKNNLTKQILSGGRTKVIGEVGNVKPMVQYPSSGRPSKNKKFLSKESVVSPEELFESVSDTASANGTLGSFSIKSSDIPGFKQKRGALTGYLETQTFPKSQSTARPSRLSGNQQSLVSETNADPTILTKGKGKNLKLDPKNSVSMSGLEGLTTQSENPMNMVRVSATALWEVEKAVAGTTTLDFSPQNMVKWITDKERSFTDPIGGDATRVLSRTYGGRQLKKATTKAIMYKNSLMGPATNDIVKAYKKLPNRYKPLVRKAVEDKMGVLPPELEDFVSIVKKHMDIFSDVAEKSKLPGFVRRNNYFPQIYKQEVIDQMKSGKGSYWDELVKKYGLKKMESVKSYHRKPQVMRAGNLEFERQLEDVPEKFLLDPMASMTSYLDKASSRMSWAVEEGAGLGYDLNPKQVGEWMSMAGNEGGPIAEHAIDQTFRRLTGTYTPEWTSMQFEHNIGHALRAASTTTKLLFSQMLNAIQTVSTTLSDYGPTAYGKGIAGLLKKSDREAIFNSGAILRGAMMDYLDLTGLKHFEDKIVGATLKWSGFSATERMNQMIDANAAKYWLQKTAKVLNLDDSTFNKLKNASKTLQGGNKRQLVEHLDNLGFTRREIAKMHQTGVPTTADINKMMYQSLVQNQFAHPSILSRPGLMLDAKTIAQFKGFAYQMGRKSEDFATRALPHPIKNPMTGKHDWSKWSGGNIQSLSLHLGAGGLAVDQVRSLRLALAGRDISDEGFKQRIVNDLFYIGTGGILSQVIEAEEKNRVTDLLLGPSISDIYKTYRMVRGIKEYDHMSLPKKMERYSGEVVPALRYAQGLLLTNDYEKKQKRVRDMIRGMKHSLGDAYNPPEFIGTSTDASFHGREARKYLSDNKKPEKAYYHIKEYVKYHMKDNGSTLGQALDSLAGSMFGPSEFEKLPEQFTDKNGIQVAMYDRDDPKINDWLDEYSDVVQGVGGMQITLLKKLNTEQKTMLGDYLRLHKIMYENAQYAGNEIMSRLSRSGLEANKNYRGDEIDRAIEN